MSETRKLFESFQKHYLNEEVEAEILRMYKADEHKQDNAGLFYTYINIETDLLGDFYVSFDIDRNKVNTEGYPWEFLQKTEYKLTPEQKELVNENKEFIETTMANNISWNKEGLDESVEEKDLSKDLLGSEEEKRQSEADRALEKYLDLAREIKAGNNDTITLDSAKKLLKDAYIKAKCYYSFEPKEIDKRIAKDIPDLFGNELNESLNLYDRCYNTDDREELKELALNAIYVADNDKEIIGETMTRMEDRADEYKEELTAFAKAPYDFVANNYTNMPLDLLREIALNAVYVANDDEAVQKEINDRMTESEGEHLDKDYDAYLKRMNRQFKTFCNNTGAI